MTAEPVNGRGATWGTYSGRSMCVGTGRRGETTPGCTVPEVTKGECSFAPMDDEYWFCLTHHTVEGAEGCRNAERLGPYASMADAAHALEKVAERNETWDNDPKWNDDVDAED